MQPSEPENPDAPPAPSIPDDLRQHLHALYASPPGITMTEEREQEILDEARSRAAAIRRRRLMIRISAFGSIAAAAVIAIVVMLWAPPETAPPPAPVSKDINGDGVIDILDAFLLARILDGPESPDPAWDFTGDGRITQLDVDAVAEAAVRVVGRW